MLVEELFDFSERVDPTAPLREEMNLPRVDLELEGLPAFQKTVDKQKRLQQGHVRIVRPVQYQQRRFQVVEEVDGGSVAIRLRVLLGCAQPAENPRPVQRFVIQQEVGDACDIDPGAEHIRELGEKAE